MGWEEYKTPEGQSYWYNADTGESSWDNPTAAEENGAWFFVPVEDPTVAFTVASKQGEGLYQAESGEQIVVRDASKVFPVVRSTLQRDAADLVQLQAINFAQITHNLKMRFESDQIYTSVGTILISVNPYRMLPLYTPGKIDEYSHRGTRDLPPHVFGIADDAYRSMIDEGINQSILISGESGAGKTEATKQVLNFLAEVAGSENNVEQNILLANPILEAAGNAKTLRNNNSSRFGKWVETHFDKQGRICAARIENYLLEKARVVHQGPEERNYHLFYQICRGADADQRARWGIGDVECYTFLTGSGCTTIDGVDDAADFADTIDAMRQLSFGDDEIEQVMRTTAAVLHLGNATFAPRDNDASGGCDLTAPEAIASAAQLLGLGADTLSAAVTQRTLKIRGQDDMTVPLSADQALEATHALAKAVYGNLFDWLVQRINRSMAADLAQSAHVIGVLDIFGFEIFESNSFEQLCINFANEKLQQHFNQQTFKLEEQLYESEGINYDHVEFIDNQPVLDLIEKKPTGVLVALDEELRMPKSTNATFLDKLNQQHDKKHPKYVRPIKLRDSFVVRHYAGDVTYNVDGFLEKNRDTLSEDLMQCICGSSDAFVNILFPAAGATADGSSRKLTLGHQFRNQLNDLMRTLGSTEPHYIRCIKPNTNKRPREYNAQMCLDQLQYAGVFEAVKIRQSGFPFRYSHENFLRRYRILNPKIASDEATPAGERCRRLLESVKGDWSAIQIGKTRVLYRANPHRSLELARSIEQTKAVLRIQSVVRGFLARCMAREIRALAPIIQAAIAARDLAQVEDVLERADAVRFVTAGHARLRKLRHILVEEKRLTALLAKLNAAADPESVFDEMRDAVRDADAAEMAGRDDVEAARAKVKRIEDIRECRALLVSGAEEWDQGVLEAQLARCAELGLSGTPEEARAREVVDILNGETAFMERLVAALGTGGSVDGDHSGIETATLEALVAESETNPMRSPQGRKLVDVARFTVRLRVAMVARDWDACEAALLEASAQSLETAEFEAARAEIAQQVDKEKVLADLATSVAAMDHVQLEYALEQATSRGMDDDPNVAHAREIFNWIQNTREWIEAAMSNVDEEQLVYAVQLADSGNYDSLEVQACRTLRDKVVALNEEARGVLETMEPERMRTVLASLKEIKCSTADSERIDELLNRTPKSKFLQLQLKAATRLGDTTRTINLTIRIKDDFFSGNEDLFRIECYDGYKTPALFAKAYTFGKDKVKAGFWVWGKKPIATSLLRLDATTSKLAVRSFKSLMVYMGDRSGSYPDALLSDIIATAIESTALRDEIYAHVIKQLSANPNPTSVKRGYQAMRMFLRTVPPGDAYANHLEVWLIKNQPELRPVLHGTLYGGGARSAPSPEEIKSILSTPIAEDTKGVFASSLQSNGGQQQQQQQQQQHAPPAAPGASPTQGLQAPPPLPGQSQQSSGGGGLDFPAPPSSSIVPPQPSSRGPPPPPPQ